MEDHAKTTLQSLVSIVSEMSLDEKVNSLNEIRKALHAISPFNHEPVDLVLWVKNDLVCANDYNPNSVAPVEMALLEHSICSDGYTQPIVTHDLSTHREVVDGFHRHKVGKMSKVVSERVCGYLPVVSINSDRQDKSDRMAATIRHNRARGKHKVESMSDIVIELKRRFWPDEKIAKELGMDADEVLRLRQVSGLASMFSDQEFSEAWEAESFTDIAGDEIEEVKE